MSQQGEATDLAEDATTASFRIFRGSDAKPMIPARHRGAVRNDHVVHPVTAEGLSRFAEGGQGEGGPGAAARVLFDAPWMHLSYAWFKSGFPLPLHSHDADCFYQIIAGSMQVGTETLEKGDGILIPAGVPYTVTPGEEGVEFLEMRPTGDYDTRYRSKVAKYWDRIVETLTARKAGWATEKPPFGLIATD